MGVGSSPGSWEVSGYFADTYAGVNTQRAERLFHSKKVFRSSKPRRAGCNRNVTHLRDGIGHERTSKTLGQAA